MPGVLAFHAHPDDEVIWTGGTLARYAAAGEQVVVITATDGSQGQVLNYDNPEEIKPRLAKVREVEIRNATDTLGVTEQSFLGYRDSGMAGSEANTHPEAFWNADLGEAASRLVAEVRKHTPQVMIIYDPFGIYGHPDHIMAHQVGLAAYFGSGDHERFPTRLGQDPWQPSKLYMVSAPRDLLRTLAPGGMFGQLGESDERGMGVPEEAITTRVDIGRWYDRKLGALGSHRSQMSAEFLKWMNMNRPDELLTEYYIRLHSHADSPQSESDLFSGLN